MNKVIYTIFSFFAFFVVVFFGLLKPAYAACCGCNLSTDSYGNCTVSDGSCSSSCGPSIPNCSNLSGPPTITLGQSGTYTADFYSQEANRTQNVEFADHNINPAPLQPPFGGWQNGVASLNTGVIPGNSGNGSVTWTPTAIGTYDVFCRAWNDGQAECRGNANYVDGPPRYTCAGPASSIIVNVINPPTPTLYPTIAITGILKESNGVSCTNNISSNSLSINIVPQYPAGVTPVCTQNPSSGNPKLSYSCTVTFNNQTANPIPAQNLTLNASASEYQSAYWTNNNVCGAAANNTIAVDVAAAVPTTTFNKDIFFNLSGPWIKLRNLSFNGNGNLNNPIPLTVSSFDSDDNTNRYFITHFGSEVGGVTSASTVNVGTAQTSVNNWYMPSYTRQVGFTPSTFFDYVKSRKDYTSVDPASFNLSSVSSGIYYVSGSITNLSGNAGNNVVIIVNGNVTISGDLNTNSGKALAVLATGNITVSNSVSNIFAILAAGGSFDTGTGSGLKIKGNLSVTSLTNQRTQSNNSAPSLFIVNDPGAFVALLPYLSISKYDQTIQ